MFPILSYHRNVLVLKLGHWNEARFLELDFVHKMASLWVFLRLFTIAFHCWNGNHVSPHQMHLTFTTCTVVILEQVFLDSIDEHKLKL